MFSFKKFLNKNEYENMTVLFMKIWTDFMARRWYINLFHDKIF